MSRTIDESNASLLNISSIKEDLFEQTKRLKSQLKDRNKEIIDQQNKVIEHEANAMKQIAKAVKLATSL